MLEPLLGDVATKVLYFLMIREQVYAREIADGLALSTSAVQKQLQRLEDSGVLVSERKGTVRLYCWNPRYPFREQLRALLSRGMEFLEAAEAEKYKLRTRPRRSGKPQ